MQYCMSYSKLSLAFLSKCHIIWLTSNLTLHKIKLTLIWHSFQALQYLIFNAFFNSKHNNLIYFFVSVVFSVSSSNSAQSWKLNNKGVTKYIFIKIKLFFYYKLYIKKIKIISNWLYILYFIVSENIITKLLAIH